MINSNKKSVVYFLIFAVDCLLSPHIQADQTRLFELLEKMETNYGYVSDYTAVFRKRERIDGQWRPEEVTFLKFQKPFKVYMRWLPGSHEGREALYVAGANHNKVLIHEAGFFSRFFTFVLNPDGKHVLKESRYPFTEVGIGRLIERVGSEVRQAWARKEIRILGRGREWINGRSARLVEGILPKDPAAGYSHYRVLIAIDEEYGLPVKASIYDWNDLLTADYSYGDLRLNPGLGEADFTPSNPAYDFPSWRISLADEG